jgi:hypothetical protein
MEVGGQIHDLDALTLGRKNRMVYLYTGGWVNYRGFDKITKREIPVSARNWTPVLHLMA